MKISQQDVLDFKQRYSNENAIIADIIQRCLYEHFEELVVDVGAGTGDITSAALPGKKVVQLDILDYSGYFLHESHRRLVLDFFEYAPAAGEQVGTLFFSHVLQFIDRERPRLERVVRALAPGKVITVTNVNDGFMSELLDWVGRNFAHANPEVELPGFPFGYRQADEVRFDGHVSCEDYPSLGRQVAYLVDSHPTVAESEALEGFLRRSLKAPGFNINQRIRVYERA
jgi:SAM-dependent methyltransferase